MKNRATNIARMEVGEGDAVAILLGDNSCASRSHPVARLSKAASLQDYHITAIAAALLEQATCGRPFDHGRDDLEEGVADRKDHVGQAIPSYGGINMSVVKTKRRSDVGPRRVQIPRHKRYLSKAHFHGSDKSSTARPYFPSVRSMPEAGQALVQPLPVYCLVWPEARETGLSD